MLGKIEGRRGRGQQRMRWLDGITGSVDMNLSKFQEITEGRKSLACYSPRDLRESDTTSQLNKNNNPKEAAFSSAQKSARVQLEVEEVGSQGAGPGTSGSRVQREA